MRSRKSERLGNGGLSRSTRPVESLFREARPERLRCTPSRSVRRVVWGERRVQGRPLGEHALQQRGGVGEPIRAGQTGLEVRVREVGHDESFLVLGAGQASAIGRLVRLPGGVTWVGLSASARSPRWSSGGSAGRAGYRMRSRKAAFTAGGACKAPSTSTEAMVARASSGVTSWAMVASPNTRMSSVCPAACAASRSSRL